MAEPEREGEDDRLNSVEIGVDSDPCRDGGSFCELNDQLSFGVGEGRLGNNWSLNFRFAALVVGRWVGRCGPGCPAYV